VAIGGRFLAPASACVRGRKVVSWAMLDERWHALKKAARKRSGQTCEGCGVRLGRSGDCHLHHLTYVRRGVELLEDLKILCLDCHAAQHPGMTFYSVEEQKQRVKLKRKRRNALRAAEAAALPVPYVRLAIRVAAERPMRIKEANRRDKATRRR
jgi:hypothetical protein